MKENLKKQPNSESRVVLVDVVRKVSGLYMEDVLGAMLSTPTPEQRDEYWKKNAQSFPPFSDKITELRKALAMVGITKKGYPESLEGVIAMHFSDVEDIGAKSLLADVLWKRVTKSPGYLDYNLSVVDEAEAMVKELGAGEKLRGEKIKKIKLDRVVEAILTDQLKLTR